MARFIYFLLASGGFALMATVYPYWPAVTYGFYLWLPYTLLGLYDLCSRHNILRNYPVIGHLRYMLEAIRPEIQQYFINKNLDERPYTREARSLIYERAKQVAAAEPFGTIQDIEKEAYSFSQHSLAPVSASVEEERVSIGGENCQQPYQALRLNISAMSFGALSSRAILALNRGAKLGGFAHNTGEGGVSPYHLKEGGDLIWQIGTGYFGCRTLNGEFCEQTFTEKCRDPRIKMIELKLSQGAKPSHGGLLPAAKVSEEIASIRNIPLGEDCLSPGRHSTFSTPMQLMTFIDKLRHLSGGKPIGFKLCLGVRREFFAICKAMLSSNIFPDFITIDGAEGGTGAAPIEFSNYLGTPLNEAIIFVNAALIGCGLRDKIKLIASGKISTGFDMLMKIALGADLCNMARPMLFALGCIQARRCHTNRCPTGITTQNKWRARAIVINDKALRVKNYQAATLNSFHQLLAAVGCRHVAELSPAHIYRRDANGTSISFTDIVPAISHAALLRGAIPDSWHEYWYNATEDSFLPINDAQQTISDELHSKEVSMQANPSQHQAAIDGANKQQTTRVHDADKHHAKQHLKETFNVD